MTDFLNIRTAVLLTAFLITCGTLHAQSSRWWYPLGTPEGARSNPQQTGTQQGNEILIKWRNAALKNSPVLLVGAVRSGSSPNEQQVVGMEEGSQRITILRANGFLEGEIFVPATDTALAAMLTGLFDSTATSPLPTPAARPNMIGIGLKQVQNIEEFFANGLLLNTSGEVLYELGIVASTERATLAGRTLQSNRTVTILPVAVWKSGTEGLIAFGIITQNEFVQAQSDRMINSLRRYDLNARQAGGLGQPIDLAPKLYPQPPVFGERNGAGTDVMALSTSRYDFSPPIVLGTLPRQTASNHPHALSFDVTSPINPEMIANDFSETAERLTSQIARLQGRTIRVTAEQGIIPATISLSDMQTGEGEGIFGDDPAADGWHIVIADIDGNDNSGTGYLANNAGSELVATAMPESSGAERWLYLMRWNSSAERPPGQTSDFHYFARQRVRGRVMAAGDLVDDSEGRKELILAEGKKLSIMQLKPYSNATDFSNNSPFATLKSFELGSDIVSVAIADLEGDGENDVIVSTRDSTYAIGKLQPNPYPVSGSSLGRKVCIDDTLRLHWLRNTYGSGTGLTVTAIGPDGSPRVIDQRSRAGDSLRLQVRSGLANPPPGKYTLIVSDAAYPWIRQVSDTFTVAVPTVGTITFEAAPGTSFSPGDVLRDTLLYCCIDNGNLTFERRRGANASWEPIPDPTPLNDSTAIISTTIPCPDLNACGEITEGTELLYRLRRLSPDSILSVSNPITITIPLVEEISVERVDSNRERLRSVTWETDQFFCSNLEIAIGRGDATLWQALGTVPASAGEFRFEVPSGFIDTVRLCIRCAEGEDCTFGFTSFKVNRVEGAYVAPNPFDPFGPDLGGDGAAIVYALQEPGTVSITIFDGARTIVRKVIDGERREAGRNREFWDGRNSLGEIVANGTYICVISSGAGEQVVLPIAIVKSQ